MHFSITKLKFTSFTARNARALESALLKKYKLRQNESILTQIHHAKSIEAILRCYIVHVVAKVNYLVSAIN